MEKINKLIQLVKKQIIEIETIKKNNNEDFNIFSILKMEKKEVETHSAFIYELLNPYGSHNQKDLLLKLFIEQVLKLKNYGKIIKVTREDPTVENRRIDFVIETQKQLIGIEMKIDASDQYEQLHSYKKELQRRHNNNQKVKLYYLTLFGDFASYESSQKLKANQDYQVISFYDNIYEWLSLCIDIVGKSITLKEAIIQYQNLINILTQKENKRMEDFINNIADNVNNIKAMNTISNNYPLIWAKKEIEFWQYIQLILNKKFKKNYDINFLPTYYENEELSYKKLSAIRLKSGKIREPFGIYLEKNINDTNYYISISILYGEYNNKKIKIDFDIYHQQSGNHKTNKTIRELKDKVAVSIVTKINFFHTKNNNNLTFQLFEKSFFETITSELANEIIDYTNQVEKQYDNIYEAIM